MALSAGHRLGPFEVLSPLGAGGMGEVYRARDSRLDRQVAIKVLAPGVAAGPDERERFLREARAISALAHPNICTLHDVGTVDGIDFLVMELLHGESLAERLHRGPLPVSDALRVAGEIARALAAAHALGIVHRDLKPANVMITRQGAKLLDFGLASVRPVAREAVHATATRLTAAGQVMGTVPYMAPEQLQGNPVDARADIFALGAMLFEMLTGRRAFPGTSDAAIVSAVLRDAPPRLGSLQPDVPPALERLVSACLAKEPEARWHCAADFSRELEWIAGTADAPPTAAPRRASGALAAAGFLAGGFLVALAVLVFRAFAPAPAPGLTGVVTLQVGAPAGGGFVPVTGPPGMSQIALAPDGSALAAIVALSDGRQILALRRLDGLETRVLEGTEGAAFPFWSPDADEIAFFAQGLLKVVRTAGGVPETLCDAKWGHGGTWGAPGLLFAASQDDDRVGLYLTARDQAAPRLVARPAQPLQRYAWPAFLPGERRFVFSRMNFGGRVGPGDILLASVDGGEPRPLMRSQSQVVPLTGDVLLYVRDGVLHRQGFDAERATLVGSPSQVADTETVGTAIPIGYAAFAAAGHVVAYSSWPPAEPRLLGWWTRAGVQQAAIGPPANYQGPRLSLDGLGLAVTRSESPFGQDVWRYDLLRGAATRLTTDSAMDSSPVWAPDLRHFTFSSMREGLDDLWIQSTDAAADATRLHPGPAIPSDWSPDGRHVLFHKPGASGTQVWGFDVYAVRLGDPPEVLPLVHTPFNEAQARFSPDGRFIAYMSDESGRLEVYVQPFPSDGRKWAVSIGGGQEPSWRRDGRELYYLRPDGTLMAVGIRTERGFEAGAPVPLFSASVPPLTIPYRGRYDPAPDGQRFLIATRAPDAALPSITVRVSGTVPR